MFGIYKITNKLNNKCYIGKSSNIEERFQYHQTNYSAHTKEWNKTLYQAFRKYGITNFSFEIIEEMSQEDYKKYSNNREQFWIIFYDSLENGYNETAGGDGGYISRNLSRTKKLTDEEVSHIRDLYNSCEFCLADAYEFYKNRISKRGFQAIWLGENHKTIKPEVFTEENKRKHVLIEHQRQGKLRKEKNNK